MLIVERVICDVLEAWQRSYLFATKVRVSHVVTCVLCLLSLVPGGSPIPLRRSLHSNKRLALAAEHNKYFRKRSPTVVVKSLQPYDWCASKSEPSRDMSLEMMRQSLEHGLVYDWEATRRGLEQMGELAGEVGRISDKLQSIVDDIFNNDGPGTNTQVFGEKYLDFAVSTPEAKRETKDNAIGSALDAPDMARKIEDVLHTHAHTTSRMLSRLELLYETESHEDLKDELWNYVGETRMLLCLMQSVYQEVAPHGLLPGPTDESDMNRFETGTLGEKKSDIMRWYGTYGLSIRNQEILTVIQDDMNFLHRQITVHTVKR